MSNYDTQLQKLNLLEEKIRLQKGLPHLYGWKFYQWAKDYFESTNHITIISAGNQISKSSTQIRKHIHWATESDLWPSLWPMRPQQFWYVYPTRDVAHIEFEKKWKPEFMPRLDFKKDPKFGWEDEIYHGRIWAVHWNSGVSTYFKTYGQNVQDLQTASCWRMDLDEECPEELMSELFLRLAATDGYLSAVFTPTLGQEYWRQVIEEKGELERFPGAFKKQISMYDCLKYADGTPSHWTQEKIQRAINACKSPAEVDRRIYGRFVVDQGLKYPSFHRYQNRKPGHPLPKDWSIWVGADIGSGGEDNHPSAITMVAVSPDWQQARAFRGWRGDGEVTTAGDVVKKVMEMIAPYQSDHSVRVFYDWASRDFFNIAQTMGLAVEPAEKSHAIGEQILNVLFKNLMLMIYDYPELDPLVTELSTLKNKTPKRQAKDDFIDSLRYALSSVPMDWHCLVDSPVASIPAILSPQSAQDKARKEFWDGEKDQDGLVSIEDEISQWNELMGVDDGMGSF